MIRKNKEMLSKFFYLTILILVLSGCSGTHRQVATTAQPTHRDPVILPPTWTLTPFLSPSETPILPPTLTFTLLPSVTPLPPTLTPGPTSDIPTPTATHTITPTVDTSCHILALETGVPILSAPFIDPYRVLPTMAPTLTYQATSIFDNYFELEIEGQSIGWVDNRQPNLDSKGLGCGQLPVDTRDLVDFPSLCTFIAESEVQAYTDRALTKPTQTITTTTPSVLLLKYSDVFYSSLGYPKSGFFVRADQVSTSGSCDHVPYAGLIISDSWLWTQPDGESGKNLVQLRPGERVFIQEGPVIGPKPPSANREGAWYLVLLSPANNFVQGWVWSPSIFIE